MTRRSAWILLAGLALTRPAGAADLFAPVPVGGFLATCEDLGGICFADACGRDQIEAAQGCKARCARSVIVSVVPATCPLPDGPPVVVLRRRG